MLQRKFEGLFIGKKEDLDATENSIAQSALENIIFANKN